MVNAAQKRSRRRFLELACICLAVALLGWFVFPILGPVMRAEYFAQDLIVAYGPRPDLSRNFVFVAIDEPSMKLDQLWPEDIAASPALQTMEKGWPWPRNVFADGIVKILAAGARVVVLDVVLDEDRGREADLKAVFDRYRGQVVLGAYVSEDKIAQAHQNITSSALRMPVPNLIPDPANDPRVGYVNFRSDSDGIVRKVTFQARPGFTGHKDEQVYQSLVAAALRQIGMKKSVPSDQQSHLFRYGNYEHLPQISFYSLFMPSDWRTVMKNGGLFRDKIVVIGPTAPILHDIQATPFGDMPGPSLHISALAAAMENAFYRKASLAVSFLAVFLAAFITLLIAWKTRNPILSLAFFLTLCLLYFALVFALANRLDYLLPSADPALVMLLAGIGCIAWNFTQARRESGRTRAMLERYVSRNLVREVLDNREDFLEKLGGTRQPVTVFFSDVRGFTSFAEREDAHAIVAQLNEYLGEMVGIIFRHQGTVDKFMGDGIMAVWGNVTSEGPARDALQAVSAALEMFERLAVLNAEWAKRGTPPFAIGIGLHHGEAIFGNIGSAEKSDPTVIGDTVNLASRVEGLTKKYGVPLCITQPLAELVADHFRMRSVDLVQVVGKSRPVEILTIVGPRGQEVPAWIKCYEDAIADLRARRFAEAAAALRLCLEAEPGDTLSAIHLRRAEAFIASPPPEDWKGTEIATSK